jgi:hypothetical protein
MSTTVSRGLNPSKYRSKKTKTGLQFWSIWILENGKAIIIMNSPVMAPSGRSNISTEK